MGVLRIRRHRHMTGWQLHEHIIPYVIDAGMYGVGHLGTIAIYHALVIALVEQWLQETYTFHFPIGETAITLQDVPVLVGLQIDGRPDISILMQDVQATCHILLGLKPAVRALDGIGLRLRWFRDNFDIRQCN